MDASHYRLIYSTCPDAETAEILARTLVVEGHAACVSIIPGVRSIYRWKGAIETAGEHMLVIKSDSDRVLALMARLRALHPYELPEIVAVSLSDGLPAYLRWITDPDLKSPTP